MASDPHKHEQTVAVPVMAYTPHGSPLVHALMEGDRVHQLMVDSRGDYAIFMLDSNGHVASWNEGAEKVKGYSHDEIVGKNFSVFYPAAEQARGRPERELLVAAHKGRFEEEGSRVRKDGSEFPANIVISAVRDANDELIGFVKVTRDLTELRKAQERARVDAQALKTASSELEAFTYSVSHDLRAPIRQIEGFSKILAEHLGNDIDPQALHYLQRIQEGSQQMGRLVDDLLHLAQIGQQHVDLRRTSLDSLVAEVLKDLKADVTDRRIEWQIDPLPSVDCDPGLMRVVFTNLLSNAVKYTRPREQAVIQVGQLLRNATTVIYVRDNGVGFDMRYANKLFGVFQRLHRSEEFEGAGVGLATARRIIRKHDGTIWAEATRDEGATFFFTLGASEQFRKTVQCLGQNWMATNEPSPSSSADEDSGE